METLKEKEHLNEEIINLALKTLTGKWKLKILWAVPYESSIRFNELERRLDGISSLMLTRRLKELVSSGILHREQYNEVPIRVEYKMTDIGLKLCPILHMLEELGYLIENK